MPTVELTPEQTTRATEIAATITDRPYFERDIARDKTLAPVFLYLAATSDSENVLVASLKAMASCWTNSDSQVERGYTMVTDTFIDVIKNRIRDTRGAVQAAALEAGAVAFRRNETDEGLLDAYLALGNAGASPALRYAVMDRVWSSQLTFATRERAALFIDALEAEEPWLVSNALFRMENAIPRDVDWAPPLRNRVLELTRHPDPGVRGRAAGTLARMVSRMPETDPNRVAATARLVEMMSDENPYAKSEGIAAQHVLRNAAALPEIATHLTDATPNTYTIRGWQRLSGSSGRTHHDGSAWSQVRDSALYAIRFLSREVDRDNRFEYRISGSTKDEDLTAAATAAQTWVQEHADAIAAAAQ